MGIRLNTTSIIFSDNTSMSSRYSIIAKNTTSIFYQPSAPSGWESVNTQNNKTLRVVNGTTGGTAGGSVDFETAFTSRQLNGNINFSGTVGSTTLSSNQIASHVHSIPTGHTMVAGGGDVGNGFGWNVNVNNAYTSGDGSGSSGLTNTNSHTHQFSSVFATYDGTVDFNVAYIDVILCKFV
jgi:hypothetical protein